MIINVPLYDGDLIHSRFAYKHFRDKTLPIGNIVAFRAPMKVEAEGMIDSEDILNADYESILGILFFYNYIEEKQFQLVF